MAAYMAKCVKVGVAEHTMHRVWQIWAIWQTECTVECALHRVCSEGALRVCGQSVGAVCGALRV